MSLDRNDKVRKVGRGRLMRRNGQVPTLASKVKVKGKGQKARSNRPMMANEKTRRDPREGSQSASHVEPSSLPTWPRHAPKQCPNSAVGQGGLRCVTGAKIDHRVG